MARALADKARTIRIPVHVVEKLNKIGRAERKLVTELGREPTSDEIAAVNGIDPEEVGAIKRSAQAPISLEKPVGDEEESEFGQFMADERADSALRPSGGQPHQGGAARGAREPVLRCRAPACWSCGTGWAASTRGTLRRRGGPHVQRDARAHPADREPSVEKLQSLAEAQKLREVA